MPLHVFTSAVGHVLVEAPQQDGPYHDGDVEPEAGQKAATLQSHIGRSDHQSFPRAVRQREEVITVKTKQTNKNKVRLKQVFVQLVLHTKNLAGVTLASADLDLQVIFSFYLTRCGEMLPNTYLKP